MVFLKVYDVMTRHPIKAFPETTFGNLWQLIFKKHINAVPVIDRKKKLVGMVTREDLLKPIYPDYHEMAIDEIAASIDFEDLEKKVADLVDVKAKDIMGVRVIFVRHDTPILRALSRMITHDIHQLPVVSQEGLLVGMVTKGDIFYALFQKNLVKHAKRIFHKKKKKSKK